MMPSIIKRSKAIWNRIGLPSGVRPGSKGIVFATTGAEYTALARRAARTIRQVMPKVEIDLFTDQDLQDDIFGKIHKLDDAFFRPKMEAMRRSRFERTIMLDADVIVLTDISELFAVLDHCEMAGVEGRGRDRFMYAPDPEVTRALPVINCGVLIVRATRRSHAFLRAWEEEVRKEALSFDQASFRRLLYTGRLNFRVIGHEYNVLKLNLLDSWDKSQGAPRILHVRALHHRPPGDALSPFSLEKAIGVPRARKVRELLLTDWSLDGNDEQVVHTITRDLRQDNERLRVKLRAMRERTAGE